MSKLQIISDKNKKSASIKNILIKKIKTNQFKKENLIIVIGWEMVLCFKHLKEIRIQKTILWDYSGNYGFYE